VKRSELKPGKPLARTPGPARTKPLKKGRGFAASPAQRDKVRDVACIVCGEWQTDPAHLTARARGGCDDPLCVVSLCRSHHRLLDAGSLDLLPYLEPRYRAFRRATGDYPVSEAA
jgi:hypothetical protein